MAIRIVQLGTRRSAGEGPRLGTVRRPPRGVRKENYATDDWFDVWLPALSPSASLMRQTAIVNDRSAWKTFERRFGAELRKPDASRLLDTLAVLSHTADFSIGCYCDDESRCHRSILRRELSARKARLVGLS
jgi:uncharacterized protein YeaO (DUF488 family)